MEFQINILGYDILIKILSYIYPWDPEICKLINPDVFGVLRKKYIKRHLIDKYELDSSDWHACRINYDGLVQTIFRGCKQFAIKIQKQFDSDPNKDLYFYEIACCSHYYFEKGNTDMFADTKHIYLHNKMYKTTRGMLQRFAFLKEKIVNHLHKNVHCMAH